MSSDSTKNNAEKLLKATLELNALIIIGLSVLEGNVRAAMTDICESAWGTHWLSHVLGEQAITLFKVEAVLISKRHSSQFVLTERAFVEGASLGFWVELLNRETYKQLKGIPIQAFKHRPKVVKRSELYQSFK